MRAEALASAASSTRWRGSQRGEAATSRAQIERQSRARPRRGAARRAARSLEARPRCALLPAHAAAADLLERQAGVEGHRLEQLRERHRAAEHAEVEPEARGQLGEHRPLGAHLARARDRRAQPLEAPVGVDDRALLLRVGLGGEDDGRRARGSPSVRNDGVRDHGRCALASARSHSSRGRAARAAGRRRSR